MDSNSQSVSHNRNLTSIALAVTALAFAGFIYVFSQTNFFSAPSMPAPQTQR